MSNNLIPTFKQTFNVEVKKGILYYPCCGGDTYEPYMLFRDSIQEFHFSDVNKVRLPELECSVSLVQHRNSQYFIPSTIIKSSEEIRRNTKVEVGDCIKRISDRDFGSILIKCAEIREKWVAEDNKAFSIVCHEADALITLRNLKNISVFYYRGDSIGEGGSGQWWLGPEIFDYLLTKLVPSAIIVTDGSNPNPKHKSVAWKPLFNREMECEKLSFQYSGRSFKYLGVCDYRSNITKAWQVM